MTVIYGNCGDNDTKLLQKIWSDLPDVHVIEIKPSCLDFENIVDEAISQEKETIIFAGHGTHFGLLHPDFNSGCYLLHDNNIKLIHARNVIGIWCHASSFAETHNLKGFFSAMFISNLNEAYRYGFNESTTDEINKTCLKAYQTMNKLLRDETPLNEWWKNIIKIANRDNNVECFNYNGLTYFND